MSEIGKQVAMHIAATSPVSVSRNEVDASLLDRERNILADQARASGKAENIIEKMVEGRLRKFYEESCLLEQTLLSMAKTVSVRCWRRSPRQPVLL